MKLIDLLVKELPKLGGWPEGVTHIGQEYDRELMFYGRGNISTGLILNELAIDHRKLGKSGEKITRAQYEAALAASKAVVGHNGWIDWHGGECPVDSDAIVEVKFQWHNQHQYNNDRAGDFDWAHTGSNCDIIAYRLHKPDAKSRSNDYRLEQDLNECIGQDFDVVNHPPHYTQGGIECIDAIKAALGEEQYEGYLRGACIKYLWRYKMKSGVESLKKAEWYLKRLIELNEEIESRNK